MLDGPTVGNGPPPTQLLQRFQALFEGVAYHHRRSNLGDKVAQFLYEDLYVLGQSPKLTARVDGARTVLNSRNTTHGVQHRRGDGSFGPVVPEERPVRDAGFQVARGPIATIHIGAEVKIISKAMIRQVDRVLNDLRGQRRQFLRSNRDAITVAIVGVNHAPRYRSFEGQREWVTTGKGRHKHPIQEAEQLINRLRELRDFDEFLIFRFSATNLDAFPFRWIDEDEVRRDYLSALVRIAGEYERRF